MGSSRARRAISRSGGNVTAISAASSYEQARERILPPALGGRDLVEREEMQAHDLALGSGEVGQQTGCKTLRVVTARLDHAPEPVRGSAKESSRIRKADACGNAQQLGRFRHAGQTDMDGKLYATPANTRHPFLHDPRVEAEVADDVGGDAPLIPHRLDGEIVLDEAVAFRIARDTDLAQAVRLGGGRRQEGVAVWGNA